MKTLRWLALIPALAILTWIIAVHAGTYPRARLTPQQAAATTVVDSDGQVLRQIATGASGRESWVGLDRISPHLPQALLASEDNRFFRHGGVDPVGVVRAIWLDLRGWRMAYGGSTLTMQLVRLIEPRPRTLKAKLREAVLAARLERVATKPEILEQYLNRVYFGNGAWGAEAAAQLYFGKPAQALSLSEATLLAVLPRGPTYYDPFRHPQRTFTRRAHILGLMQKAGMITEEQRSLAERTPLLVRHERPDFRAPHFVDHVLASTAAETGATVRTTLDGPLQRRLEVAVRDHAIGMAGRGLHQAGVVVLRHSDGAVLAMVGSRDYFDQTRDGAVNVTTVRRRPGSALKPFVYALALEQGDSPATIAHDVVLPREARESWAADVRQHGPARYREALAGSYNLAAVHTLERVGVGTLLARLRLAGLQTLDWPDDRYAPNLAIGEGEVRIIDLAAAFAAFGNDGRAIVPRSVQEILRPGEPPVRLPPRTGPQLFSPEVAWLTHHVLSDPDARRPMFGQRVPMMLPFPVALKTGTTRAYTDTLAFGVTREYTVGAWGGNFDGSPTHGVMAMQGAAPLVRAAFVALAERFGDPTAPARPAGLIEQDVCPLSGLRPGPACPHRKQELFRAGTTPTQTCDWHVIACGGTEVRYPAEAAPWARARGLMRTTCSTPTTTSLQILSPADGARFLLDPFRARRGQIPPLRAAPSNAPVRWSISGLPPERFQPTPGEHRIRAQLGHQTHEVTVRYE